MSILVIESPTGCKEEHTYIFETLFRSFLGIDYVLREVCADVVQVKLGSTSSASTLVFSDIFFQEYTRHRLSKATLPRRRFQVWNVSKDLPEAKLVEPVIPIICGKPLESGNWFEHKENAIRLGLDIAGSSFLILTRFEEVVLPDRDEHDRFPARASLAYQEGFLERPIVDEYVEILWRCIQRLWPSLKRKERSYQIHLSWDVDNPFGAANKPWVQVLRGMAGDLVKRKDLRIAYCRFMAKHGKNPDIDPFNTFDFIMDVSEQHGLKSAFYFKAGSTNSQFDEDYALESPWIQGLLRHIHERDHEIGLHTSYEAYRDPLQIQLEFRAFLGVMDKLGIRQQIWGGRQHYLRFEVPTTWQAWEEAGLNYNATVGFADHVGFRCGTCHEFTVFNLKTKKTLRLRERPLIAMDGTLLSQQYMALRPKQVLERIERLSNTCRQYGGTFSLLWHNINLIQSWQRQLYLEILKVIT